MPRTLLRQNFFFPFVLVCTVALALAPGGGFGFTKVMSEIFRIAITPFSDPLNAFAAVLRTPPPSPNARYDGDVQRLSMELEDFRRLYLAEQDKVTTLQRQLAEIQKIDLDPLDTHISVLAARVAMRSPIDPLGPVTLNRGSNHGVTVGSIAVYDAVHLIGQVQEVSAFQCTLIPLAAAQTKLVDARILPKDHARATLETAIGIQLQAMGDGTLTGSSERLNVINPGDEVLLFGISWPASAQAMRIGVVDTVKPDDMQPLRNVIVVRPAYQISQVADLVLKIEQTGGGGSERAMAERKSP